MGMVYAKVINAPRQKRPGIWEIQYKIAVGNTTLYTCCTKEQAEKYQGAGDYKLSTYKEDNRWYLLDWWYLGNPDDIQEVGFKDDLYVFKLVAVTDKTIIFRPLFATSQKTYEKTAPSSIIGILQDNGFIGSDLQCWRKIQDGKVHWDWNTLDEYDPSIDKKEKYLKNEEVQVSNYSRFFS